MDCNSISSLFFQQNSSTKKIFSLKWFFLLRDKIPKTATIYSHCYKKPLFSFSSMVFCFLIADTSLLFSATPTFLLPFYRNYKSLLQLFSITSSFPLLSSPHFSSLLLSLFILYIHLCFFAATRLIAHLLLTDF
jgi:hypothetical protein